MSHKPALPPLDADLDHTRTRVDLKALRPTPQLEDGTVEENARRLGRAWGAATSLPPGPAVTRAPMASLRIEIPTYLDDELTQTAAAQRVTKQYLVLTALRQAGYQIEAADIVADRRKARRQA